MGKAQHRGNKEQKKKAQMTLKEKRAARRNKTGSHESLLRKSPQHTE